MSGEKGVAFIAGPLVKKGSGSWRERVLDVAVVVQLYEVLSEKKTLGSEPLDWLVGLFVSVSIVAVVGCSGMTFRIEGVSIPPSVSGFGAVVRIIGGCVGTGIVMLVVGSFEIVDGFFAVLLDLLFFTGVFSSFRKRN